jgi:tetratricopeptide (TPR) repeat protein/anti-sigma regulatory factor (Ser/Thr protein kinase)
MKLNSLLPLYLCSLFSFFQITTILAQDSTLDSLATVLKQSDNDSTKLDVLLKLSIKTLHKDPDKCLLYILEGLRLAEKNTNYKYLVNFNMKYSQYLASTNTLDSAIIIIEKATSYLPHIPKVRTHLTILTEHATLLKDKGDFSGATQKYLEALKIAEKEELPEVLAACYIGLSTLFASQKMYTEAIGYNQKCVGACGDMESHRVPYCFGLVYGNLSMFYLKQKQLDSAIHYGLKSIQFKEQIQNIRGLSFSYNLLANTYLKKKDTLAAISFLEKALVTTKKTKDISSLSTTLQLMGKIHLARKDLTELSKIVTELDSILTKTQNPTTLVNYYQIKRNYFELKKDYKSALEFVKKQFDMVDSIRKESNSTLIASLETKYRTNQFQLEKELAEKELLLSNEKTAQSKRNLIGLSIFSLLIILLFFYILSRLNIIKQQKIALNEAYELLEKQKKNEVALLNLKALQAQMNPHFLFNALNSIQDLVLLKDIKNSTIYLGKFSALIRKILLSSKDQFISLDQEIEMLQLYLDLEKLRFGNQFEIKFNCDISSEEQLHILLPAMFIQPYVENAIKHGLFHKKGLKKLLVEFTLSNNFLTCIIEDNGIGQKKANEMKIKTLHLHTGFSTEAIQNRVKFLNQTLNKKILIETIDLLEGNEPKGTRVTLQFSVD